jgi:hypothetical protein
MVPIHVLVTGMCIVHVLVIGRKLCCNFFISVSKPGIYCYCVHVQCEPYFCFPHLFWFIESCLISYLQWAYEASTEKFLLNISLVMTFSSSFFKKKGNSSKYVTFQSIWLYAAYLIIEKCVIFHLKEKYVILKLVGSSLVLTFNLQLFL